MMNRRTFLFAGTALGLGLGLDAPASFAVGPIREIRIGYQKSGILLVLKAQKLLEKRFGDQGGVVKWVEFPFGPPLLEALSAGSIDYGATGDAPPIFAQAAHGNIRYVGVVPGRGDGQAIIVPTGSPIKTLTDLKGRKIGVAKGSSAHNLLVAALESERIAWGDITPVYLAPADAAAAFARGAIDAWSIWDPFYAIAETKQSVRRLPVAPQVTAQNSFFLANRDFVAQHADVVAAINGDIANASIWADRHRNEAAALFTEASGVDIAAQTKAVERAEFTFGPLDEAVIAQQQAVADRFHRLGLIPAAVTVRDIVWAWKPNS